jgi:hypothetical protein
MNGHRHAAFGVSTDPIAVGLDCRQLCGGVRWRPVEINQGLWVRAA